MAELTTTEKNEVKNGIMGYLSKLFEPIGLEREDLLAAINATDTWIDNNSGSYNTALPQAARDNLTANQKTMLFCAVASRRVSKAFTIRLFGRLD